MIDNKGVFRRILIVLLIGLGSVVSVLLLLSQGASARPLLDPVNLSITKSANTNNVQVGDQLIYSLTYTASSTTMVSAVITDTFDPRLGYVSASITPTGETDNVCYWTISFSGSVSNTIVLTVSVPLTMSNGTILTNDVIIDSAGAISNSAQITTTVDAPTLELVKRAYVDPVPRGAPLTYTLTYSNTGDADATNVVITDILDSKVTYLDASPSPDGGGSSDVPYWYITTLTHTHYGQIVITVTVDSELSGGETLTNTATIDSDQTTPLSQTETTTVSAHGDAVSVTLAPPTDTLTAGQSIAYTLTAHDAYSNDWDVTISGTYTITTGAGGIWATNIYTAEKDGTWTITATYNTNLTDTSILTVTNVTPSAVISGPNTGDEGENLTFDASLSSDPGNDIVSYEWDLDYSGTFITDTSGITTTHIYTEGGNYVLALRVTDDNGAGDIVTAAVTVTNLSPTADAGESYDGNEASSIQLDGSGSDPGGGPLTYAWDIDNDGQYDNGNTATKNHSWGEPGIYTVSLMVTDSQGLTDTDTTTVTVNNLPPTADAGESYDGNEAASIQLDGSGSDPGGGSLTYAWDLNDDGSFDDAFTSTTSSSWGEPGIYTVSLMVTDGQGLTDTDTTTVTVNNLSPTADAGEPYEDYEATSIQLDGSGSTDPGGGALTYIWDLDDDGLFDDAFTYTLPYSWGEPGTYTVSLMVTDGQGLTDTDTTTVTVNNLPPTADAGESYDGNEAAFIQLDGSGSTDPGGGSLTYAWDLDDNGSFNDAFTSTTSYSWGEPGTYIVSLMVTDGQGFTNTNATIVTVHNLSPTVSVDGPHTETAGISVTLTATGADPGGGLLTYNWDIDDDGEYDDASGDIISPSWTVVGVYTVSVQVTDAQGATDTDLTQVSINPAELHHIILSPQTATIFAWETQSYTVEAFDVYDNSRGNVTLSTTFNITQTEAGGSWSYNIYTPGNHGDWTVQAVYTGTRVTSNTADLTVLSPVLHIAKAAAPDPVEAGDNLTYTITYSNTGNYTATAVTVTDAMDPNVSYVRASPPRSSSGPPHLPSSWDLDDLAPGERRQITLTVSVARPLPNGTILTNVAWIDADYVAPVTVTLTTTVHSRPIITVEKLDYPDPVNAGGVLRYTFVFTNSGNENATSITITEYYDPNASFFSANPSPDPGGDNVWTLPVLPVDQTESIDIFVRVNDVLPVGTVLTNETSFDSDQTSTISATETTSVTSVSELTVYKLDSPGDGVPAGDELMYVITYQTSGSAPAEDVVITEMYDDRVNFISASPSPDTGDNVWNIGDLDVNKTGNIIVLVQVDTPLTDGTVLTNRVTIDSSLTSPKTYTETTTVSSAPDITLDIAESSDPVQAGAPLTYTLHYVNDGNADATQTIITATLDTDVSFDDAWPTPIGGTGNVRYWDIGEIAGEGGEGEIVIRTVVTAPLPNGTVIDLTVQLDNAEGDWQEETAWTTVASAPVLPIHKSANASVVDAGGFLTYTIVYSNTGNEIAHNVVITDVLDPNTIYDSATPSPTVRIGDTLAYWNIGNLTPTVSGQITVRVRVNTPLPNNSNIANTIWIDSEQTAPSSAVENTTVRSAPILHIKKSDAPDPVDAGAILTYTFVYSNTGNEIAHNAVIADLLDANVSYLSASPTPDGGTLQNAPYWNVGDVTLGTLGQITLRVRVHSPLPNNTILTNTVSIDSDQTDPQSDQVNTLVQSAPVLQLVKSGSPDPVQAGDTLIYTLVYSNTGNEIAHGVVITDLLDPNTVYDSASPAPDGGITQNTPYWVIGDVAPGAPVEITLHVTVTLPLTNGTILTNTAFLNSDQTIAVSATETTTVESAPILSLDKDDGVSVAAAGDTLIYTITYTNSGNENEYGIVITDTLPDHVTYVSCEVPSGDCQPDEDQVVFHIPTLAAPTYSQAYLTVRVDDPLPARATTITNYVTMTAPSLVAPIHVEDVDSISTRPDLSITVGHSPELFSPGGPMRYSVTYGNIGHMDAKNVIITTTLPTDTIYVSSPGWSSSDGRTYVYTVGQLPAGDTGDTATFTVLYITTEPQEIASEEFHTIFTIVEADNIGEDADLDNNAYDAYIGVPDLIVTSFTAEPWPLEPGVPATFTVVLKNQGTGKAWNPDTENNFYVDIFVAPVDSYPNQRAGDFYTESTPIEPGGQHTVTVPCSGFTQEDLDIEAFYVKVDNHEQDRYPHGLVPESNEMNNVGILFLQPYSLYLPLIQR